MNTLIAKGVYQPDSTLAMSAEDSGRKVIPLLPDAFGYRRLCSTDF